MYICTSYTYVRSSRPSSALFRKAWIAGDHNKSHSTAQPAWPPSLHHLCGNEWQSPMPCHAMPCHSFIHLQVCRTIHKGYRLLAERLPTDYLSTLGESRFPLLYLPADAFPCTHTQTPSSHDPYYGVGTRWSAIALWYHVCVPLTAYGVW